MQVGLGSDGVRDSWSPFGNADMLHVPEREVVVRAIEVARR